MLTLLLAVSVLQQNVHPRRDLLFRPAGVPVRTVEMAAPTSAPPPGIPGTRAESFGALDDPPDQVFAAVSNAAIDSRGRIVLLDGTTENLRIIAPETGTVSTLSRTGRGPEDLFHPQFMTIDAAGRILVGDLLRRIQVFTWDGGRYRRSASISVPVAPWGICVFGQRVFIHGMNEAVDQYVVHEVNRQGRIVRSFGRLYGSNHFMVRYYLSRSMMACDQRTQSIVLASTAAGEAYAFSLDGTPRWITSFAGYRHQAIIDEAPRTILRGPEGGWNAFRSVVPLGDDSLLVQVVHRRFPPGAENSEEVSLHSYLLSARTGAGRALSQQLPTIVFADAASVLSTEADPLPTVTRWRRGAR